LAQAIWLKSHLAQEWWSTAMATVLLRAPVAAVLLCLLGYAAAGAPATCPSATTRGAGGAGGVRVLDGIADEGALAELLSQVPAGIASAAKAGEPLERQRFVLRAPDALAKSVAGALGRRGAALGAVASEMPASADGQNVSEHQDRHTSGRIGLAEGDVAVLYLHGRGEVEFTGLEAADGCAASRVVDVAPGRLVLWNNAAVKHRVASVPGSPRIFVGPMALAASGKWDQVGGPPPHCRDFLGHAHCKYEYCPDKDRQDDLVDFTQGLIDWSNMTLLTAQCCSPCTCADVLTGDPDYVFPNYVTNCSGGEIPDPAKAAAPAPTRNASADGCCMAPNESAAPGARGLWSALICLCALFVH